MATIKGQNLRILMGEDIESLKCVAASTSCQLHAALEVAEDTTKDDVDGFIIQEPVGISWDVSVAALVVVDSEETGVTVDDLVVGALYKLRFSQTAGASGEQNRDAVANGLQLTGDAVLSDIQLTAQNQDESVFTAKFTGHGDLIPTYSTSSSQIAGGSSQSESIGG